MKSTKDWYLLMMGFFAIYFVGKRWVPHDIQKLAMHPVGRVLKSTFWIMLILYFY